MSAKKCGDFSVLPLKFVDKSTVGHDIYFREHSSHKHEEDKPLGRTLFIVNIPPYVNESNLKQIFSLSGEIRSVVLINGLPQNNENPCAAKLQKGFQSGYIVFKKRESLLKALELTHLNPISNESQPVLTGLLKYVQDYNNTICNVDELKEKCKKVISDYDLKRSENNDKDQIDDDGWTVVGKKGRNPGLALKESVDTKLKEKIKKKEKKILKNFYPHQIRESKQNYITALREKYQADKKRIEVMKHSRTFRPY